MGSDGNPSDAGGDPPKKKGLNLSLFLGPTTDIQTSKGKIYLYRPRVSDYTSFEKLSASEPTGRFREFLPHVASLSATSKLEKEREPLAQELVAQLSNEEVETLAEAYASSTALQTARVGSEDKSGLPREEGESATSYVDRLLKKELAVSFSEDDCTIQLGMKLVVHMAFDSQISELLCTKLVYAQYSCAPKRGEHGDRYRTDYRARRGYPARTGMGACASSRGDHWAVGAVGDGRA